MSQRSPLSGVLRSLPWPAVESISAMISGAITVFFIARMIGAEAFGRGSIAFGVVLVMLVGVNSLVHDALVRLPDLQWEDVELGFSASLALALIFSLAGALAAPWLGYLFEDQRISYLTWAFLPMLPLAALSEPLIAVHRRALDFRTVAIQQIGGRTLGAVLGLIAAWNGAGAWSLVLQYVGSACYLTVAMIASAGRLPHLRFSWRRTAPLLAFCSPIIASQLLTQGTNRVILMGVGHWHGVVAAGHWSVATRIAESIFGGLNQAAYNVSFAHFSLQQDAREKLAATMRETQAFSMVLTVPVLSSLAAASDPLIRLLLGPNWTSVSALMLGPLAASFLLVRRMLPTTALRVVGRSRASLVASIAEAATALTGLFLVGQFSVLAVSALYPLGVLAGFVTICVLVTQEFDIPLHSQLFYLFRDASIGLGAFIVGKEAAGLLSSSPILEILAAGGAAFLTAAILLIWAESALLKNVLLSHRLGAADKSVVGPQ